MNIFYYNPLNWTSCIQSNQWGFDFMQIYSDVIRCAGFPVRRSSSSICFKKQFNMDVYFEYLGLYLSDIAKDATCLFRAVSEQLFGTQFYHRFLLVECAKYMKRHFDVFEQLVNDLDFHIQGLLDYTIWAGPIEMNALSYQYKINFEVYVESDKPSVKIADILSDKNIVLVSFSGNRYDCVYKDSNLLAAAICQSYVYEILYKGVFKLDDVDFAVQKMLHDKNYSKQRKNQAKLNAELNDEMPEESDIIMDYAQDTMKSLEQGIPPFPYKVAKALDRSIYRNVEFGIWNEEKKELLKNEQFITPAIGPGVRCKVFIERNGTKISYNGHVQDVEQDKVNVYIEELCKKCCVALTDLEVVPVPQYNVLTWQSGKTYRMNNNNNWNAKPEFDKKPKKCYKNILESNNTNIPFENKVQSITSNTIGANNNQERRSYGTYNSRFRTPPRNKNHYNYGHSGNYKRSYRGGGNNKYGHVIHHDYGRNSNEDLGSSPPSILPPVPPSSLEDDSGFFTSISQLETSNTSFSEDQLFNPIYQTSDHYYSSMTSTLDSSFSSPVEPIKYGNPVPPFHQSTPLQIPRAVGHRPQCTPDEMSTLALTPITPTMSLVPYPTYYMYSDAGTAGINFVPYYGCDISSGISSMYINTPPSTGFTPPSAWINGPFGLTQNVPTNNFVCSAPVVGDLFANTAAINGPWGTPPMNVIMPTAPFAYFPSPTSEHVPM